MPVHPYMHKIIKISFFLILFNFSFFFFFLSFVFFCLFWFNFFFFFLFQLPSLVSSRVSSQVSSLVSQQVSLLVSSQLSSLVSSLMGGVVLRDSCGMVVCGSSAFFWSNTFLRLVNSVLIRFSGEWSCMFLWQVVLHVFPFAWLRVFSEMILFFFDIRTLIIFFTFLDVLLTYRP